MRATPYSAPLCNCTGLYHKLLQLTSWITFGDFLETGGASRHRGECLVEENWWPGGRLSEISQHSCIFPSAAFLIPICICGAQAPGSSIHSG